MNDNTYLASLIKLWSDVRFEGSDRFAKFETVTKVSKDLVGRMSNVLNNKVWMAAKRSGWEAQFSASSTQGSVSLSLPDEKTSEINRQLFVEFLKKI